MNKLIVLGIDGLGYTNLTQHQKQFLPRLNKLCETYTCTSIPLDVAISPRNWTRIFSGQDLKWYNLFIKPVDNINYRLIRRHELPVKFIWEKYPDMIVINAPVVIPPICRNTEFKPVAYGLPLSYYEAWRELNQVRRHTLKALDTNKPIISVTTVFDRILHITGNEATIKKICIELDEVIHQIIEKAIQNKYNWIIISDHAMKRVSSDTEGKTAPRHDMPYIKTVTKAIHGHDENSLFISNLPDKPTSLTHVYQIIERELKQIYRF